MKLFTIILAFFMINTASFISAKPKNNKLTLKTERVIIFKDGYCLVVKKAVGKTDSQGQLYMTEIPDSAILGSFWAGTRRGKNFTSMTAEIIKQKDEKKSKEICTEQIELLQENKGKNCEVQMSDNQIYKGKIIAVLAKEIKQKVDTAIHPGYFNYRSARISSYQPLSEALTTRTLTGSLFILASSSGEIVLSISRIKRLKIKNIKYKKNRIITKTKKEKRLTFQFNEKYSKKQLTIMYFTPGMRWIPTYRIKLSSKKKSQKNADIALQAEILNELENFTKTKMDLVVGVPNFRFRKIISPLSLEKAMRNTLNQAAPQIMGQISSMSNALFTQRRSEHTPNRVVNNASNSSSQFNLPKELSADSKQDFFVYHIKKISLNKGARTAIPIFKAQIPYRDIYTWNIALKHNFYHRNNSGKSPLKLSKNRVWHQIELTNTTQVPWTTGAAIMLEGLLPLGQELLTYTSRKGSVRIPVTIATDIQGYYKEKELKRLPKNLYYYNHYYFKIIKEGQLKLINYKKETIDLEIVCDLGGVVTSATQDGIITLDNYRKNDWAYHYSYVDLNNHSQVIWKTKVKPGKTFKPKIKYYYHYR